MFERSLPIPLGQEQLPRLSLQQGLLRHPIRLELLAQEILEQRVVAESLFFAGEPQQEEVGLLEVIQQLVRIGDAEQAVAKSRSHHGQDGSCFQEVLDLFRLLVEDFLGQVIEDLLILGLGSGYRADQTFPQRMRPQQDSGDPAFGFGCQLPGFLQWNLQVVVLGKVGLNLLRGEGQVLAAQPGDFLLGGELQVGQIRHDPARQDQAAVIRLVIKEPVDQLDDGLVYGRKLEIIDQDDEILGDRLLDGVHKGLEQALQILLLGSVFYVGQAGGLRKFRKGFRDRCSQVGHEIPRVGIGRLHSVPAGGKIGVLQEVDQQRSLAIPGGGRDQEQFAVDVIVEEINQAAAVQKPHPPLGWNDSGLDNIAYSRGHS